MKILQTIGKHGGRQRGIFQYKRDTRGVEIDLSIGRARLNPSRIRLTNQEWTALLEAIRNSAEQTFRLTVAPHGGGPPNQDLYTLIENAVPHPAASRNWRNWHDSFKAAICAILEHEGSVDLYHGMLGQNASIPICLRKDI